jgi:hypothetical protein
MLVGVKDPMASRLVSKLSLLLLGFAPFGSNAQDAAIDQSQGISLTVPAGVPLRLYLTKRVPKKANAPVEAKLLNPLYVFDHEVIPAGTAVLGHVSSIQPVPKWERIRAVLAGDFTPLHVAQIEFTSLVLPDGRSMGLHTIQTAGLKSLVPLKPPKQRSQNAQSNNTGVLGAAKQSAKDQENAQIDRVRSIPEVVRGTDKKEWLYGYAMSRLPVSPAVHPQSDAIRCGTPGSAQFWIRNRDAGFHGSAWLTAGNRQPRACKAADASRFDHFDARRESPGCTGDTIVFSRSPAGSPSGDTCGRFGGIGEEGWLVSSPGTSCGIVAFLHIDENHWRQKKAQGQSPGRNTTWFSSQILSSLSLNL